MTPRLLIFLVLLLEARGLNISITGRKWMILIFYTQLSNLVTALSALLYILFPAAPVVTILRYLSTCMLVMTFIVTTCVLIPMGGDPKKLLWSGNGIYHHVLCPVVSTVSYVGFERHVTASGLMSGAVWLPVIVTLLYGLLMLYLNWIRKVDGPYPFFRVHQQSVGATVLWIVVLMAVMTGISAGVMAVAR